MISFRRPVMYRRPLRVEPAEVAGVQPSVLQRFRRGVRAIEVLAHDDRSADQHLAVVDAVSRVGVRARARRFRLEDPDLDARKRLADRLVQSVAGPDDGGAAGRFRQAVGIQDREAEAVEIARDRRIELRAARDEAAACARRAFDARARTRAWPGLRRGVIAQPDVRGDHDAQEHPRDGAALANLAGDPLVDEVEELRHAREDRDAARRERRDQRRRADRVEKHHARADRKRQQQVGHLRERVEQRQHAENRVGLGDLHDRKGAFAFGVEVGVRQDDALGIGGGAGGVQNDGRVRRARLTRRLAR